MTPLLEEARRLLALAQSDRAAFLWLLRGPGIRPAAAFFFAQQAVEKALKAVMIASNLVPTRTHNLLALAAEINAAGVATPRSPEELAALNPCAVTLRYDDEDIVVISADHAQRLVDTMLDWAEQRLTQS